MNTNTVHEQVFSFKKSSLSTKKEIWLHNCFHILKPYPSHYFPAESAIHVTTSYLMVDSYYKLMSTMLIILIAVWVLKLARDSRCRGYLV